MSVDTKPQSPETGAPPRAGTRRRRVLRVIGKTLIGLGVLVLAFVAYELWGTGVVTDRAQDDLREQVEAHGFDARPIPGGALGFIRIPKIDLDMIFVEGADAEELKKGPGHYEDTAMPGERGNVGIAGHRTTYLHPFWDLQKLRPGDIIELQTRRGTFRYSVRWQRVVRPLDVWVIRPTKDRSLTLTTCNPRFSARERLIIRAVQVAGPGPHGGPA
ncbi:MAG: sortase [Actinobacteria bacterium]|nr:sortase [Actinomycetota bacterium]